MKRIISLLCVFALLAIPMTASADAVEKVVPVEARKAFNEKEFSMAHGAINHEATVVEQADGKYQYTIMSKPMKLGTAYGHLLKLFVYDGENKVETKKESVSGMGEYDTKFTFTAEKSDKIKLAVWVDAMDEIAGGGPGSGEQDVFFCFDWSKAKEKGAPAVDKKVTVPVGTDPIQVFVDGNQVKFDAKPFITNGRTLVPMRAIFEALDATVEWDDATKTATAKKDAVVVKIKINSTDAFIGRSGTSEVKKLDAAAIIKDGRTFVPLRFIGEAFNNQVSYDKNSNIAIINIMK